jgi:hypothetical protein
MRENPLQLQLRACHGRGIECLVPFTEMGLHSRRGKGAACTLCDYVHGVFHTRALRPALRLVTLECKFHEGRKGPTSVKLLRLLRIAFSVLFFSVFSYTNFREIIATKARKEKAASSDIVAQHMENREKWLAHDIATIVTES